MTIEQTTLDTQPPDTLSGALQIIEAWEKGETTLSPDGIAVALYLQRAQISRIGAVAAAVEVEVC